jgi:hypothetical protein
MQIRSVPPNVPNMHNNFVPRFWIYKSSDIILSYPISVSSIVGRVSSFTLRTVNVSSTLLMGCRHVGHLHGGIPGSLSCHLSRQLLQNKCPHSVFIIFLFIIPLSSFSIICSKHIGHSSVDIYFCFKKK